MQLIACAERKPLRHRLNALAIARTDQSRHVERAHLSPCFVTQPIHKRLEPTSELISPIRRPANHGRPLQTSRPPMSHRKSDLGIPCPRKICQSSASFQASDRRARAARCSSQILMLESARYWLVGRSRRQMWPCECRAARAAGRRRRARSIRQVVACRPRRTSYPLGRSGAARLATLVPSGYPVE